MNDFERMIISVFRRKWSLDVLYALGDKPLRFTELQHVICRGRTFTHGAILVKVLRLLEDNGYVEHAQDTAVYQLTELGIKVRDKLEENNQWCREAERRSRPRSG